MVIWARTLICQCVAFLAHGFMQATLATDVCNSSATTSNQATWIRELPPMPGRVLVAANFNTKDRLDGHHKAAARLQRWIATDSVAGGWEVTKEQGVSPVKEELRSYQRGSNQMIGCDMLRLLDIYVTSICLPMKPALKSSSLAGLQPLT